jgi:hypothetical protein
VNEESLIAILAAILSVGHKEYAAHELLQDAAALLQASQRYVKYSKETTMLKIDYEVETATPEQIERILKGEA